jgi:long-chain acyl-CoA synthetase
MLYDILIRSAQTFGDRVAIEFKQRRYSYRELLNMTDILAESFRKLGLKPGNRLSLYLYNCPEIVLVYFACFKLGVTVVPINYRLKEDEARYIINHSRPTLLISEQSLFCRIAGIRPELASLEHCYLLDPSEAFEDTRAFSDLLTPLQRPAPAAEFPSDSEAVILYTSGTTGAPKGAVLAHDQMMTHTRGHCDLVRFDSSDRVLVCLALANNFAFSHQMLCSLCAGATLVIAPDFDPDEVLEKIEHEAITMLYMMPVMYHALNKAAESKMHPLPNRLRLAIVAGDTTPAVVFENFKRTFGLELCEGIGMTETQIYALNPTGAGKQFGSVGRPVGYTEVAVQDDEGSAVPTGEIGEIAVRGNIVLRRYLDNPEANASSFRNGWFLTGDLGTFNDDGYLWFRGRRKQLIVHDGHNISPQEVEEVFYRHPSVFEVGVVGIPDAIEGETLHAFVALKEGTDPVSPEELLAFASEHIAEYKLPENITFIDTLPKGTTGKIDRKLLRESKRA